MSDLPEFEPKDVELTEVIEHDQDAPTERSAARRVALQVLYEIDCVKHPVDEVIDTRLQDYPQLSKRAVRYVRRLVHGVMLSHERLDVIIRQYAPEWPLEQIAIVDRNILRIAIYELVAQTSTPVGVVIAEAVELGGFFGAEGAPRFINGVLGALAETVDDLRAAWNAKTAGNGE